MAWLLKRSQKLSRQGYRDEFNRPDENPIQPPWKQWGQNNSGRILNNKLRLDDGGFFDFSHGGWSLEYQPLTENWGYEFQMDFLGSNKGSFYVYLDRNWTRGQKAGENKYSTYIQWQHDEDNSEPPEDRYRVKVINRDKDSLFPESVRDSWTTTAATFLAPHVWKIDVFADRVVVVSMDGTPVILCTFNDSNYYFNLEKRGANLRSNNWDTDIDWFYPYDWRGFPFIWTTNQFGDSFDRPDGAIGNGWTQLGNNAAIRNNSWSTINTSDGSRAILRTLGITSGRVGITAILGGNINPTAHEQGMVLCSNSAGTQGLIARVTQTNAKICRFSSALSGNPPSFTQLGIYKDAIGGLSGGQQLYFEVYDGNAYIWRGTELLAYATNVHAVVPATNSYQGLQVSRALFQNSGSWNSVNCYAIA